MLALVWVKISNSYLFNMKLITLKMTITKHKMELSRTKLKCFQEIFICK